MTPTLTSAAFSNADDFFTVVFAGDIRAIAGNPLKIDTPFGMAVSITRGDMTVASDITEAVHSACFHFFNCKGDCGALEPAMAKLAILTGFDWTSALGEEIRAVAERNSRGDLE